MTAESKIDLFDRIEPLHPDLVSRIMDGPRFPIPMVHHPLVVAFYPGAFSNAHLNSVYQHKLEALAAGVSPTTEVALHERAYRLERIFEFWRDDTTENETVAALLAEWWTDSESATIFGRRDLLIDLLDDTGFVTDREGIERPKDALHIFRGGDAEGLCWSTSPETARWFAKRFDQDAPFLVALCPPAAVRAIFLDRGEDEVVVDPELLTWVQELDKEASVPRSYRAAPTSTPVLD